jgi:hypothetical protein
MGYSGPMGPLLRADPPAEWERAETKFDLGSIIGKSSPIGIGLLRIRKGAVHIPVGCHSKPIGKANLEGRLRRPQSFPSQKSGICSGFLMNWRATDTSHSWALHPAVDLVLTLRCACSQTVRHKSGSYPTSGHSLVPHSTRQLRGDRSRRAGTAGTDHTGRPRVGRQ